MNVSQLKSNSYSSYVKINLITLVKITITVMVTKTNQVHLVNHNPIKYKEKIAIITTLVVAVLRNINIYSNK